MDDDLKLVAKFPAPIVTWCSSQALFALHSHDSNLVEIYRVTYEIEKIVDKVMPSRPSCLKLSTDGCLCVIGFADGHLGIYKTDSMQEIQKCKSSTPLQICL